MGNYRADRPTHRPARGTRARPDRPTAQCPSTVGWAGCAEVGDPRPGPGPFLLPPLTSPVRPASLYPRDRPEARPRRPRSYLGRTPGRRLTSRWSGGRARSARRSYTGPPPPTAPTWSLVHTLLATDSSILTLSSAVVTPYYSLRPFLPSFLLPAPLPPSVGPSVSLLYCTLLACRCCCAEYSTAAEAEVQGKAARASRAAQSNSNPNSNQTSTLIRFPSDTIPHFSFTSVKFRPNPLHLKSSRRRQSIGVTKKSGQLSLSSVFHKQTGRAGRRVYGQTRLRRRAGRLFNDAAKYPPRRLGWPKWL